MTRLIGKAAAWLTTVLVIFVCIGVVIRYGQPGAGAAEDSWRMVIFGPLAKYSVAIQELQWYCFGIIFLLAAAWTLQDDKHVRVDVLYARMTPKMQALVNLIGSLLFLLTFSLLVIWFSQKFLHQSFYTGGKWHPEGSPNPGGLPWLGPDIYGRS